MKILGNIKINAKKLAKTKRTNFLLPILPSQEKGDHIVPVNEHKKSFRSEKMYVHKTQERSKNCSNLCCWLLAVALLAKSIAVAVLIGSKTRPCHHLGW